MKKVLNGFGIILAVLFSLALIPMLIVTPVWEGVSALLEPEFLEQAVSEVVEELQETDFQIDASNITGEGIDPALAQAIANSAALREIAPLLGQDVCLIAQGKFVSTALTAETLQRIGSAHRQELAEIFALLAQSEGQVLSADEAGLVVDQLLADAAGLEAELTGLFLDMQTELQTEYGPVLALLSGPIVTTALLIAALVLAFLIFLCRWPHQEGFLWLGIDAALAALPVLGIAVSIKGTQFSQALSQGMGVPNIFAPVLRQAGNAMLIGGAVLLAVAVLLIAAFILLRDRRLKREAAYADKAPTAPQSYALPRDGAERSPWDNV